MRLRAKVNGATHTETAIKGPRYSFDALSVLCRCTVDPLLDRWRNILFEQVK